MSVSFLITSIANGSMHSTLILATLLKATECCMKEDFLSIKEQKCSFIKGPRGQYFTPSLWGCSWAVICSYRYMWISVQARHKPVTHSPQKEVLDPSVSSLMVLLETIRGDANQCTCQTFCWVNLSASSPASQPLIQTRLAESTVDYSHRTAV